MSSPMNQVDCPSDETLAAFVDQRLDSAARAAVLEHLVICPDCYSAVLAASDRASLAAPQSTPALPFRPRVIVALAGAVAAVAAIIFLAVPLADRIHGNTGIDALTGVLPDRRPVEARLTGFEYHPMAPVVRGEGEGSSDDEARNWKLLNAASRIEESAARKPTAANLHALGVSRLVLGQSVTAVAALEKALAKETGKSDPQEALAASTNASLLSDLSAALATDAARSRNRAEAERAVLAAERSWSLGKSNEAAWNRAVAIEAARGRKAAAAAWRRYLTVDTSSPWAAEAQDRAKAAAAP